jgi:hypothetical protein
MELKREIVKIVRLTPFGQIPVNSKGLMVVPNAKINFALKRNKKIRI